MKVKGLLVFSLFLMISTIAFGLEIKGDTSYKQYDPIILTASGASKGAQFDWDISDGVKVVDAGDKLYVWAPPGTYKVKLAAIDFDAKKWEKARFEFTVLGTPTPVPPDPGPGPNPPPNPAPIPVVGYRALIVYETSEEAKYPKEQANILYAKSIRDFLNVNCVQEGNQKGWWILDKDTDVSTLQKHWQDAMKRDKKSLPWIIVSNGKTGYEGPLPANVDATLNLLKKYVPSKRRNK